MVPPLFSPTASSNVPSSTASSTAWLVLTVKAPVCTSGQPGLLMVMGPVTAPAGTLAVICVLLLTVKVAVALLANLIEVTPVKLAPVIVTLEPTAPLVGLRLVTVGQLDGCPVATVAVTVKLAAPGPKFATA